MSHERNSESVTMSVSIACDSLASSTWLYLCGAGDETKNETMNRKLKNGQIRKENYKKKKRRKNMRKRISRRVRK